MFSGRFGNSHSSTVLILFLVVVFKCNFPHLFLPPFFLSSIYSVLMVPVMEAKMTQNSKSCGQWEFGQKHNWGNTLTEV